MHDYYSVHHVYHLHVSPTLIYTYIHIKYCIYNIHIHIFMRPIYDDDGDDDNDDGDYVYACDALLAPASVCPIHCHSHKQD